MFVRWTWSDHTLQVRVGEVSFVVEKRFSQFQAMHALLVEEGVDRWFLSFVCTFVGFQHLRHIFQLSIASQEVDWEQRAGFHHEKEERAGGVLAGWQCWHHHHHHHHPVAQLQQKLFRAQAVCHFLERNLSPHLAAFLGLGQVSFLLHQNIDQSLKIWNEIYLLLVEFDIWYIYGIGDICFTCLLTYIWLNIHLIKYICVDIFERCSTTSTLWLPPCQSSVGRSLLSQGFLFNIMIMTVITTMIMGTWECWRRWQW